MSLAYIFDLIFKLLFKSTSNFPIVITQREREREAGGNNCCNLFLFYIFRLTLGSLRCKHAQYTTQQT